MRVEVIRCGQAVNKSEAKALDFIETRLKSTSGNGKWVLLANLDFSSHNEKQSDEIDIVAIGPPGLTMIEVKHWSARWVQKKQRLVIQEAEKVTRKARRIGTSLRKIVPELGFVSGVFLITDRLSRVNGLEGEVVRGIPFYRLHRQDWKKAIGFDGSAKLNWHQIYNLAKKLAPQAPITLDGKVRNLCGCLHLELQTDTRDRFHRVYRGVHHETNQRVFLHVYDLSATDDDLTVRAQREFDALNRLYKRRWTPRVRDSFQAVEEYPGEMYFYTLSDDGAVTLENRSKDDGWATHNRLCFALDSVRALKELHSQSGGPMLHRNLTPETIQVQNDNSPLLSGFEFTRIPEHRTVAKSHYRPRNWRTIVAPEVLDSGLQAADCKSDSYSLCKSLQVMFAGRDDEDSELALEGLVRGSLDDSNDRESLEEVEYWLSELIAGSEVSHGTCPPEEWDDGHLVGFRGNNYRIVERLGSGGVGIAFKVDAMDPVSEEIFGAYVGKTVQDPKHGRSVLRSYNLARPHLWRSRSLSAIYEVADEWQPDQFVALMTFIPGFPLSDLVGEFPPPTASHGTDSDQALALNWLNTMCAALEIFHSNDLVHGDVSTGNVIVSDGSPVLTDYDLVTKSGEQALSEGTPRYCSPTRQEGGPATPADDIYALAASFFHVLFGVEPFGAGVSASDKQNGLNWEAVNGAKYPAVSDFLRRATSEGKSRGFRDATEALAALAAGSSQSAAFGPTRTTTPIPVTAQRALTPSGRLNYVEARSRLVDWLRSQLIGPLPYSSETLRDISPVRRFPLGVLYPVEHGESGLDPAFDASRTLGSGENLVDEREEVLDRGDGTETVLGRPVQRRRYVPPSSVGFSCFVRGNVRLRIDACAVAYERLSDRDERGRFTAQEYKRSPLPKRTVVWEAGAASEDLGGSPFGVSVRRRSLRGGSILTVTLFNRQEIGFQEFRAKALAEKSLFEAHLECCVRTGRLMEYPRVDKALLAEEEREIELQYRDRAIYAIGHGGSVDWELKGADGPRIWTEFLPSVEVPQVTAAVAEGAQPALDLKRLADSPTGAVVPDLERFIGGYADWIAHQNVKEFAEGDQSDAVRIEERMTDALDRMRAGVSLIAADPTVASAFQIANRAMLDQMRQGDLARGRKPGQYEWRPFQLAFLLTVIKSTVTGDDSYRSAVDLIWFPTGGGKTEAYLGLIAFLVAWRRLQHGASGIGTVALMRYTLRLLTSQQFERAARMVFALELIRRSRPDILGSTPITVGMWVGQASSPNRYCEALDCVEQMDKGGRVPGGLVLASCPWCGTEFTVRNYRAASDSFSFTCTSALCGFGQDPAPLPCNVVDEALYESPPSLLIATIDKFARLAWESRAASFFGESPIRPPELIIQDELHLVTGPLGSVAALYEAGLDALLRARGTPPKYVASTATIHMAEAQAKRLYGRPVRVFPPPGLTCDDCYFARTDSNRPGRLYIGYLSPMLDRRHCLAPLAAALLAAPECIFGEDVDRDELVEAWWTQVVYHTSLISVGNSHTSYAVDVRDWERRIVAELDAARTETLESTPSNETGGGGNGSGRATRLRIDQLTSVKGARDNAATFARLAKRRDEDGSLDVVLATNMISVGLDVSRLALMIVNGQPLTTGEYIQASSRVGRSEVPGLVAVSYHRDQASSLFHYENFRPYHESFYRFVEAATLTPFSYEVRSRALHAALVSAIRHACPDLRANQNAIRFALESEQVRNVIGTLKSRCAEAEGAGNLGATSAHIDRLVNEWQDEIQRCRMNRRGLKYDSRSDRGSNSLLIGFGMKGQGLWRTLHSMRDVEQTAVLKETQRSTR